MPNHAHDETALVKRAVDGSADAFGELYLLHLDAIYRYVRFRVGNSHDAEDLTEHVFLKAWEALPNYKLRGLPFSSWLYRIAHNVVIDHRRRAALALTSTSSNALDYPASEAAALDQIIEASEVAEMAEAIKKLPEDQQQVLVLRFIEGLSHAEVARIINKTEGACRVIQHRALAALSRLLAGV